MLVDIGAHLFAAAGRLTYEEGRPARRASRISPDVLTSALGAVSDLALALSPEEAAAANAAACRAVLPLLRGSEDPGRVAAVKEGIKTLHAAAVTGQPPPDGVQQQLEAALRDLSSSTAGKRKAPERSSSKQQQESLAQQRGQAAPAAEEEVPMGSGSSKRQHVAELDDTSPVVFDLPCQTCGLVEGDEMLVCEYCSRASNHLECAGLSGVPEEVWVCKDCEGRRAEAQEAADMEGRWALGVFPGYDEPFWGRVATMGCFGQLEITFSDGEVWQGVRMCELMGKQLLAGKISLQLQPEGCVVPSVVLKRFRSKV